MLVLTAATLILHLILLPHHKLGTEWQENSQSLQGKGLMVISHLALPSKSEVLGQEMGVAQKNSLTEVKDTNEKGKPAS